MPSRREKRVALYSVSGAGGMAFIREPIATGRRGLCWKKIKACVFAEGFDPAERAKCRWPFDGHPRVFNARWSSFASGCGGADTIAQSRFPIRAIRISKRRVRWTK